MTKIAPKLSVFYRKFLGQNSKSFEDNIYSTSGGVMKKLAVVVLVLSSFISSCGNAIDRLPPQGETSQGSVATPHDRLILSQNKDATLFAVRSDGMSDYKLHVITASGYETVAKLADGGGKMVMGAALSQEPGIAYVALRDSSSGSSKDSIVKYDFVSDTVLGTVSDLDKQDVTGLFYNTLEFFEGKLRFVAEKKIDGEATLPEASHLEIDLGCLNGGRCGEITPLTGEDASEYQDIISQKLNSVSSGMGTQGLSASAYAVQMYWPKGVSGHHTPGSTFHTGNDAYSLDINRGGGETDYGDPVRAASSGKVIEVIHSTAINNYGNRVRVQHANGSVTLYAHLKDIYVTNGSTVSAKQSLGTVGNSGLNYAYPGVASHLHFTLYASDGRGVYVASEYYPMYARVGSSTAACSNITTDLRDGREYFPC